MNIKTLKEQSFKLLVRLPVVSGIAAKELSDVYKTISDQFRKIFDTEVFLKQLQMKVRSAYDVIQDLKIYEKIGKIDWKKGRASGNTSHS